MLKGTNELPASPHTGAELLRWLLAREVHEFIDVGGRPVGEGRARAFGQVHTVMQTCSYPGSRFHHSKPMNLSALRHMLAWDDVLVMLSWFSRRFAQRFGAGVRTCDDLAIAGSGGIFLLDYLALRRPNPVPSGSVPLLISGLYKVSLGLQLAYMHERYTDNGGTARLPDPFAFLEYLEQTGLLIGEAEVCSGSPKMIRQAYQALVDPMPVTAGDLPTACADLAVDWNRFDEFWDQTGAVWRTLVEFALQMQTVQLKITAPEVPVQSRDRLNELLDAAIRELLDGQTGLVVEIARGIIEETKSTSIQPLRSRGLPHQSELAQNVVARLRGVAVDDVVPFHEAITVELADQLAVYEALESRVVVELNHRMRIAMDALGRSSGAAEIAASVLSIIFGRTLRDLKAP